ncbi:MAG: hypothetical protein Q9194_002146 [Teloschistes cf. exilis]
MGFTEKPRKVVMSRIATCSKLAARGRKELFRSLVPDRLETKEAVLPSGILTLLLKNVCQDITKDTMDTQSTYSEYILKLEQDIQRKPYSRSHQEKLNNVRQEIYCILECLASQSQIVNELETFLRVRSSSGFIYRSSALGERRESHLLQHAYTGIDYKKTYFEHLERHARDLASFNLVRIESSKDRQEAAIFVFTVVTIIFLPLSFVSSFFGMNVNDIRNMGRSQWVFWASALPLTAIVAGLALLIAYKIEPVKDLWSGIAERWRASKYGKSLQAFDSEQIASRLDGYAAITDAPGSGLVPELLDLYFVVKVICTVRDPQSWKKSMEGISNTATMWFLRGVLFPLPSLHFFVDYINVLREAWLHLYGEREPHTRLTYNRHIAWLKKIVREDCLVFFDVKDGWEPLCAVLGKDVPDGIPFPRINDGEANRQFREEACTARFD